MYTLFHKWYSQMESISNVCAQSKLIAVHVHCKQFCCHSQMESISSVSLFYMYTPENGPIDYSYVFAIKCPYIVNTSVVIVKWGLSVMFLYLRENQSFFLMFHMLCKHYHCLLVVTMSM